ncbi:ferrous iron transport protein A [bacterium]|nr:ferrous iron transport protein A [bacterium]
MTLSVLFNAMNMWQLPINQKAKIKDFAEDLSSQEKTRLEDLGFRLDEQVLCLRRMPFGGPTVFQTQFTVYALEKDLAQKVFVESLHE